MLHDKVMCKLMKERWKNPVHARLAALRVKKTLQKYLLTYLFTL